MEMIEPTREQVLEFCAESPSSASSSRTSPGVGSVASSRLETSDGSAAPALPRRCEPRSVRVRAAASIAAAAAARRRPHDHRRGGCGRRALGRGARRLPAPREDRPGQPVYAISEPPRAGRQRPPRRTARPTSTCSLPACAAAHAARARRRPARARRRRLPLAHARRRSRRHARGSGSRDGVDPLQGRGLGVDAERGAGRAGLGRPRSARPRLREPRAARSVSPAAREDADRDALRPHRERACDRASTRRSACSTSSSTAPCSFRL